MIYASVCDGIGAAHCAWSPEPLGWRCAWTSEIAPFPAAVVDHHWHLPNLGDMTTIDTGRATDEHGQIDLVVGGTPCQSFSVAGLRKGLDDPRGNLALVFLRLLDRLRPRWVVWENVPGVLSSGGGRDFGSFLGGLGQLGYGWAYRVLDAQFVTVDTHPRAVPQRRKRVFVVGYLGDARRARAVLFERESMRGDTAPRRVAGAGVARTLSASTGGASAKEQQYTFVGGDGRPLNPLDIEQPYAVGNCLTRRMHKDINTTLDEGQTPIIAFDTTQLTSKGNRPNPRPGDSCHTLSAAQHPPAIAIQERADGLKSGPQGKGWRDDGAAYKLEARHRPQSVVAFCNTASKTGLGICEQHAPPITARNGDLGMVSGRWGVRRLMPVECERLQGFPDHHTRIKYRGKRAADTPRYQALGNSMAVNVMRWLGLRIEIADGIGS